MAQSELCQKIVDNCQEAAKGIMEASSAHESSPSRGSPLLMADMNLTVLWSDPQGLDRMGAGV